MIFPCLVFCTRTYMDSHFQGNYYLAYKIESVWSEGDGETVSIIDELGQYMYLKSNEYENV
jgi:hypothetical protein